MARRIPDHGRSHHPQWLPYAEALRQFVADKPDATLAEVKEQLAIPLSIPTLSRALRALRFTFKKKSSTQPSRTGRPSRPGAPTGGSGKAR
jgi:transposase